MRTYMGTDGGTQGPPLHLLVVEDNPGDVRLLQETLREGPWQTTIDVVRDGSAALQFMRREGKFSTARRPDIVLLDLNLPRTDGRHVLAEVRGDRRINGIPIVVLTASRADEDVLLAFNFQAEGFLRKPVSLADLRSLVDRLTLTA